MYNFRMPGENLYVEKKASVVPLEESWKDELYGIVEMNTGGEGFSKIMNPQFLFNTTTAIP